jgi:anti-anti-sigma regulatory factor
LHALRRHNGVGVVESTSNARRLLSLPADCSIAAIRGVCELVKDAFGREDKLEIDCSSVDKADVTSVQLLLSTARTANLRGRPIVLTAISQVLRKTFHSAGVSSDAMNDHRLLQEREGK